MVSLTPYRCMVSVVFLGSHLLRCDDCFVRLLINVYVLMYRIVEIHFGFVELLVNILWELIAWLISTWLVEFWRNNVCFCRFRARKSLFRRMCFFFFFIIIHSVNSRLRSLSLLLLMDENGSFGQREAINQFMLLFTSVFLSISGLATKLVNNGFLGFSCSQLKTVKFGHA